MLTKEQFVHYQVIDKANSFSAFITIVYAKNELCERRSLSSELKQLGITLTGEWLLCGDFNTLLSTEDRLGSPVTEAETLTSRTAWTT